MRAHQSIVISSNHVRQRHQSITTYSPAIQMVMKPYSTRMCAPSALNTNGTVDGMTHHVNICETGGQCDQSHITRGETERNGSTDRIEQHGGFESRVSTCKHPCGAQHAHTNPERDKYLFPAQFKHAYTPNSVKGQANFTQELDCANSPSSFTAASANMSP